MMSNSNNPIVETQMMIRKPAEAVFRAFIDPAITTKFWFTKSSGSLVKGEIIFWEWEMYGASAEIKVLEIIPNKKITIEWDHPPTIVNFEFNSLSDDKTLVIIRNHGFHQTGDELIEAIKNNTGGFTTVLDGLKAFMEHGIELNLVKDKFPQMNNITK
jgi:uncharacterized protein YndB with AHSA1/START domain